MHKYYSCVINNLDSIKYIDHKMMPVLSRVLAFFFFVLSAYPFLEIWLLCQPMLSAAILDPFNGYTANSISSKSRTFMSGPGQNS